MLSTFESSGLVLNKDKFTRPSICSFISCESFGAELGQFSSLLVHLLCPLHNTLQVTSVSNTHQTNPLEVKRCEFALDTLDHLEILQASRAMMLFYALRSSFKGRVQ